jgi:predicted sulfurtransferase/23S rRNA-/tRNA-specific pseudouridylate synthase
MSQGTESASSPSPPLQHVILFYRYHPLTADPRVELYRGALERLCQRLELRGRILVGASQTEGINGSLAGRYAPVRAFTRALLGRSEEADEVGSKGGDAPEGGQQHQQAVRDFWKESQHFFQLIGEEELRMPSPDDFKWSTAPGETPLFPDLRIVVRPELIGTGGGAIGAIPLEETATGYLSPAAWHARLAAATNSNTSSHETTVVIDCRNTKEYEIGRFAGALNPHTTTFSQFPNWVQQNKNLLSGKEVLMYCTGGIRCEKASALIRRSVPDVGHVGHLKGGIHKYLEEYGGASDSLWHGKNFVFDGRQAVSGKETQQGKDGGYTNAVPAVDVSTSEVVGKCLYCEAPFDQFDAKCVCTVCREPLLACSQCRGRPEFHCQQHFHLRTCYFSSLDRFTVDELKAHLDVLRTFLSEIAVGRKFKQKRKTLLKQCQRILDRIQEMSESKSSPSEPQEICRNCGSESCTGKCWGFFGLKRKEVLESQRNDTGKGSRGVLREWSELLQKPKRQRQQVEVRTEIERLDLFFPCSQFRNPESGIRVPPCIIRELKCNTKAKWCGRSVVDVVQEEFTELARADRFQNSVRHGLLRLNGKPLKSQTVGQVRLKSSDVLSRVLHWHEAPVIVPPEIGVEKVALPCAVAEAFGLDTSEAVVYVCDKPSSVPVHPAGPYFSNVLTFLVEAQLGLSPRSLHPVHRTDRVTSGLTLCCTHAGVAKAFHRSLTGGSVKKMYLAKVRGRFPSSEVDMQGCPNGVSWDSGTDAVQVDAPVYTIDPANGTRVISEKGKQSLSRFRSVSYDEADNSSIICCYPVTGRNHQLRLHLSWIGYPILNDTQYGGETALTATTDKSAAAISSMLKAGSTGEVSSEAMLGCAVCKDDGDGIQKSFTAAQLLKEGYAIMLHAFRYEVGFFGRKGLDQIGSVELSVGLPSWVNPQMAEKLTWLK